MKTAIIALCLLTGTSCIAQKNTNNRAAAKDSIGKIKEIRNPFDSNKLKQPTREGSSSPAAYRSAKPASKQAANKATKAGLQQNGYANQEVNYANGGGSEPEKMATTNIPDPGGFKMPPQKTKEAAKTAIPEDNSPVSITLSSTPVAPYAEALLNLTTAQYGWYKTIQFSCEQGGAIRFVKAELLLEDGNKKTIIVNDLVHEGEKSEVFQTKLINELNIAQNGGSKKTSFKLEKIVSVRIFISNEPGATSKTEGLHINCYLCK